MTLLAVRDLRTQIRRGRDVVTPVDGISFDIAPGETVGLVGESGCGKTMTGMSIMRLLPGSGRITAGSVRLAGRDLASLGARDMRQARGRDVAMVFQDPMTSLNPTITIGRQITEAVRLHRDTTPAAARERALEVLRLVGMPQPEQRLGSYPHELSGGQRQRVMIALALACEPKLLIADEPTTALDVTIQAQILELLRSLRDRLGMGVLLITHDLGVIAGQADRVLVMYAGRIVESAPTRELFARPRHPYTEALLGAIPRLDQRRHEELRSIPGLPPDLAHPPAGCRFAPRCAFATDRCRTEDPVLTDDPDHAYACFHPRPVRQPAARTAPVTAATAADPVNDGDTLLELVDVHKEYPITGGFLRRRTGALKAVSGISLTVAAGETFALVGESGCGKSTTGRLIVGLDEPTMGTISFAGRSAGSRRAGGRMRPRDMQLVFQDPSASLDPRMKVGTSLAEPLLLQHIGDRRERAARVGEMVDQVGLARAALDRYPHEFSGGQRQRIGLARALMLRPRLVVADEPVSALDVSVQSQVLNLMRSLQRAMGLTYVVISHDLSVVKYLADRIGVMYLGKLVEVGAADGIYRQPAHPYTAGLLDAIPEPDPVREREKEHQPMAGELPSAIDPPSGCRFRTRCPLAQDRCAVEEPVLRPFSADQSAACHFPLRTPEPAVGRE
ncbi:MAG TPA: ABC transporter ATP-binding protein [Pseudonocardiaceae bacterium]|nr:ABC transporter ATP-binding protein [Pseudonocardiaceae bacterium]